MPRLKTMSGKKTLILVEPEQPENTGFAARLSANFDYDLELVKPVFNLSQCRKTARRAQERLRGAKIHPSLEKALENKQNIIGTKPGRGEPLQDVDNLDEVTIVVGRESSGLKNSELSLCDRNVHIETSEYSSLNQSHAAAILMYHFH